MKEFLAGWIVVQLIVMGFIFGALVYEQVENGCVKPSEEVHPKWQYQIIGAGFPLLVFIDSNMFKECTEPLSTN